MIELSSPWKRKSIQAEPELLRIVPVGEKTTAGVKAISIILLLAFYIATIVYANDFISKTPLHGLSDYILSFGGISLAFTCCAMLYYFFVIKENSPLIFTSAGLVGIALMAVKYEQLDGYNWERCKGLNSSKTTLALLPKGIFSEGEYRSRAGNSIFEAYGYFFDNEQMRAAEAIFEKAGVVKVNIRSWG